MEESREERLRSRARELTEELGVDIELQSGALLARLMRRCLEDSEIASTGLESRLERLVPSRHAKVQSNDPNETEIVELAALVRQPPLLLERMWRAYLAGYHDVGRGTEGSGKWTRVSSEARRLRDEAIENAATLPEEFAYCLRSLPTAHPSVAAELLRERLEETLTLLKRMDDEARGSIGMPKLGRRRHRQTLLDQRDLEAYFLCRVKNVPSSDTQVREAFATNDEKKSLRDPRVAAKVNRRASNAIGKMAERLTVLVPNSSARWRVQSIDSSRLDDPHRARELFLEGGPPTEPGDIEYLKKLDRWCEEVPPRVQFHRDSDRPLDE